MKNEIVLNTKENIIEIKFIRRTEKYRITNSEKRLLIYLADNELHTKEELMKNIYGFYYEHSTRLNTLIVRLRKDTNHNLMITNRMGIGFKLEDEILFM